MDFDVFLEKDETDTWIAEVPSLPGVYSQGETKEDALGNVKDAIRLYLETEGVPPSRAFSIERVHIEA
ncbi:MAG: type II toxin-antitoxin system HicB family antitoxin [Candidatus Thermoplasmatota archaeon]